MTAHSRVSGVGLVRTQYLQFSRQPPLVLGLLGASMLLVLVATLASVALVQGVKTGSMNISEQEIREIPGYGLGFAHLLVGATVTTLVTAEWSSGAIIGSVATTQRRGGLVWSKSVVAATATLAIISLGVGISVLAANLVLSSENLSIDLSNSVQQRHVGGIVASSMLTSLMAVGLAFLIRRTATSIVAFIAIVMVAPIALGVIPWTPLTRITSWLPLNSSGYMILTGTPPDTGLSVQQGYLAMSLWALAALAAGWWRMTRTDI